jgi:aspartyl-tRNA(Asn)/glutamyl-tRNA(Gln) amidotransferase subunit C
VSIGADDVRHIALLARLAVDDLRIESLAAELRGILDHMVVLQAVDTSGVQATAGVSAGGTPLRADSGPSPKLAAAPESFAPGMRDGLFIVPRLATHGEDEAERAP